MSYSRIDMDCSVFNWIHSSIYRQDRLNFNPSTKETQFLIQNVKRIIPVFCRMYTLLSRGAKARGEKFSGPLFFNDRNKRSDILE